MYMTETWKVVATFDNYEVSSLGRIRHRMYNRILKHWLRVGYPTIELQQTGRSKRFHIHRLVAEAFIPNPTNSTVVNHINSNRQDNQVKNLEWCNFKENLNYHHFLMANIPYILGKIMEDVKTKIPESELNSPTTILQSLERVKSLYH